MSEQTSTEPQPQLEDNELPTRFEIELEFIQSLANIPYVTYLLTQLQLWKDPKFKRYLKYLEYWYEPEYAQCIVYPNSLFMLKLLNTLFEGSTINDNNVLEGCEHIPRILQSQGTQWMNEMVERWREWNTQKIPESRNSMNV